MLEKISRYANKLSVGVAGPKEVLVKEGSVRTAPEYSDRIDAEISNFEETLAAGGVTHSIPKMFTWWASTYLSPRLLNVFGSADIAEIFASEMVRCARATGKRRVSVLSLGSGDCAFERSVHEALRGRLEASWSCTDLNPAVTEHARNALTESGVGENFSFNTIDLNIRFVDGDFDVVIINHSLHHFLNLEFILERTRRCLTPGGCLLVSDMIGRNGHMRWPEALAFVEALWRFLPDKYRFNNHAKCIEGREFNNYDCTSNGDFEGVRAQDILPLLIKNFGFERFVGFGNIADIFLDRAYGHNFDPHCEFDVRFIEYSETLNIELIDRGVIKPTMMIATLVVDPVKCVFDRWSPEFSVRDPES